MVSPSATRSTKYNTVPEGFFSVSKVTISKDELASLLYGLPRPRMVIVSFCVFFFFGIVVVVGGGCGVEVASPTPFWPGSPAAAEA